jgi:ferric-dicitrate binding protein FerR (iron transport regulator)
MMTGSEFTDLLNRFEKGLCTPEEKKLLEQWLDSGSDKDSFHSDEQRENIKASLRNAVYEGAGLSGKSVKLWPMIYKIAASVILIAVVGYGSLTYYKSEADRYATTEIHSGNEIKKILLSDGSIVWLKPNSSLSYPGQFRDKGERMVALKGEALFEVEKNPAMPFIVYSGEITTTVLGTSFNIRNKNGQTEVFVLTGKVTVTSSRTNSKVELIPEEKAVYKQAAKQLEKAEKVKQEKATEYIKGTEYSMNFSNIRISEIAKRIEGKFNVDVELEGAIASCMLTADFTDQSLKNTLEMITEALNASYEINKDRITLSGEGCQ